MITKGVQTEEKQNQAQTLHTDAHYTNDSSY
ncbi:hypothetical protein CCP2SC5_30040 [Azospirillaceae bacterium]